MRLRPSTEALARVCARRPWLVVAAWAAILLASSGLIGGLFGSAFTTQFKLTNNPQSQQAESLLERLRGPERTNEIVIVRSTGSTVDDPQYQSFVLQLYEDVSSLGPQVVAGGTNYYQRKDETLVSSDRRTTILPFVLAGTPADAKSEIGQVLDVAERADGSGGYHVLVSGGASFEHDMQAAAEADLQTGEGFGIPIALGVLVLVFGALAAALIPLVLALLSIVVAVGLTSFLGQFFQFSFFVTNVITMMGLAVGIDYSLFVVSRYREERQRGLEKLDAIAAAGATASRAVFFSGMTVVLALLGMLIVPSTIFRSLAGGAISVVVISVAISLTLLPAIIGLLGDRVNAFRVPFIGRASVRPDHEARGGFWDLVTRTVMRFPAISLVAACALLIALAVPYFDIKTGAAGVSTMPTGVHARDGFDILEEQFSFGIVSPAEVAIAGDINSPPVQDALQRLEASLKADAMFGAPAPLQADLNTGLALLSIPVAGDPLSAASMAAVGRLRDDYVPQAFATSGATALVGGVSSANIDYLDTTDEYTPIVVAFVLAVSFILLTVVFRSLVVPLKAIAMNLLSVGAAYGLLVLVFQKGIGNEIFAFQKVDVVEAWIPLWTFSILFGLSMDYHVFLLSRIRERFNRTRNNTESVAFGLRSTAGIITGAALIMAGVFGGIAAGDLVMFQQMGFGLGVAILLDATVVRSVLVPAAMQLLGDKNWYLPRILRWLPEIRTERL